MSLDSIMKYLQRIERTQQEIIKELKLLRKSVPARGNEEVFPLDFPVKFPLSTMEDFDALEVHLSDKSNQTALTKEFGGRSVTEGVFSMMYHTFTNDLQRQFSFLGNSKTGVRKRQFNVTRTYTCLMDAFCTKPELAEVSFKEIKEKIIDWLRHANSRYQRQEQKGAM